MSKLPAPKKLLSNISEFEWDFRNVQGDELKAAIFYEYAREQKDLKECFEDWHRKTITVKKKKVTVKTLLDKAEIGLEIDPMFVEPFIETNPDWSEHPHYATLDELQDICPLFPKPYLSLDSVARVQWKQFRDLRKKPAFQKIRAVPDMTSVQEGCRQRDGEYYFTIKISIHRGVAQVEDDAKKFFRELYREWRKRVGDERAAKFQKKTGGGPSDRWTWLKDLAAYRISNSGRNYIDAQEFITKQTKVTDTEKHQVLPIYKNPGRWSEACGRAKSRIRGRHTHK